MRELINDPFYELIGKFDRCIIDYCLIEDDTPHHGKRSHKDAILFAMLKVIERYIERQLKAEIEYCREVRDEPFPWNLDIGKAQAHQTVLAKDSMTAACRIHSAIRYRIGMPSGKPRIRRDTGRMISARSIPFCSRRERMNLKYMSGQQTGRIISMPAVNGGALPAGAYMISAWIGMP